MTETCQRYSTQVAYIVWSAHTLLLNEHHEIKCSRAQMMACHILHCSVFKAATTEIECFEDGQVGREAAICWAQQVQCFRTINYAQICPIKYAHLERHA
jgi:hypothetical protein